MAPIVRIAPFLLLALTPACVTKAKYTALQAELDRVQQELQARDADIAELEAAVKKEVDKVVALEAQLVAARDEHQRLEAQIAKGEGDMATLLKDRSRLKESIDEMSKALADSRRRRAEAEKRVAEYRDMLMRFKGLIEAGKLDVRIVDGRMVLALPMDILFNSGSSRLSEEGKKALTEVGAVLATIAERRFQVEGHTDNVPIHNEYYANNWELASARALAVVKTLRESGVAPQQLSAASFGEFKPAADNTSDQGKARNRRIEIVIVPDLTNLPGFEELNALAGG